MQAISTKSSRRQLLDSKPKIIRQAEITQKRQRSRSEQKERPQKLGRPAKKSKSSIMKKTLKKPLLSQMDVQKMTIHEPDMIIDNIKNLFIDFFTQIGIPKGFVFDSQERKKFNLKIKKMEKIGFKEWSVNHQWNADTQNEKLLKLGLTYGLNLHEEKFTGLRQAIIEICCICASECTSEFYNFLLNIFLIISTQKDSQQLTKSNTTLQNVIQYEIKRNKAFKQLARMVHGNTNDEFYFLSMNFHRDLLLTSKSKRRIGQMDYNQYEKLVLKVKEYMQELVIQHNQ